MQLSMLRSCGVAVLLLAACGGDDGGPGPLDNATRDQLCHDDCERTIGCQTPPGETLAECMADCQGDLGPWVRTDVAVHVFGCRAELACDASDDGCVVCAPTSAHERYEATCRANLATCDVNLDELCEVNLGTGQGETGLVCIITPALVDQLTACIPAGVDCATGLACIDGVIERNNIDF